MERKLKTLGDLRQCIRREIPYIDEKPYSHNIISLCLMEISQKYGIKAANKAVTDLGLDKLGWHTQKEAI